MSDYIFYEVFDACLLAHFAWPPPRILPLAQKRSAAERRRDTALELVQNLLPQFSLQKMKMLSLRACGKQQVYLSTLEQAGDRIQITRLVKGIEHNKEVSCYLVQAFLF